jgi:hypothetical protein
MVMDGAKEYVLENGLAGYVPSTGIEAQIVEIKNVNLKALLPPVPIYRTCTHTYLKYFARLTQISQSLRS